jgi:single-strand DNA-binding protein
MYNKVFLIGNLTRDPDLRYTPSGIPVARFAVAVNRFRRKGAEAESGEQGVDFINIVAWRRLAEICGEFLKKGRPVAIEGRLQIRSYTGRDGQKRTMTEVVADNMQMLGRKSDTAETSVPSEAASAGKPPEEPADEIPF